MRLSLIALATAASVSLTPPAFAEEGVGSGPWQAGSPRDTSTPLAQAGTNEKPALSAAKEKAEAPWYGKNNVHKYLGLGSIGSAAMTIISPKGNGGPHERFAQLAAALGVAAVGTGFYAHSDDLSWELSNPDTQHAALGALGTLGFIAAVAQGGKTNHAAFGAIGGVAMATAIKITW